MQAYKWPALNYLSSDMHHDMVYNSWPNFKNRKNSCFWPKRVKFQDPSDLESWPWNFENNFKWLISAFKMISIKFPINWYASWHGKTHWQICKNSRFWPKHVKFQDPSDFKYWPWDRVNNFKWLILVLKWSASNSLSIDMHHDMVWLTLKNLENSHFWPKRWKRVKFRQPGDPEKFHRRNLRFYTWFLGGKEQLI